MEYDALSRVVKSVARWQVATSYPTYDPNDRAVKTAYDGLGRVLKTGQAKQFSAGNPDADYAWTQYVYSKDGLLEALTDANGKTTTWDYRNLPGGGESALGRLRKMTYPSISGRPDEGVVVTEYDKNANAKKLQFRQDVTVGSPAIEWAQSYDDRNRLTNRAAALIGITDPPFPGTTSQAFSYDDAGMLTVALDRNPSAVSGQDVWVENRFDSGGRPFQQIQRLPINGTSFVEHVVKSEFYPDGFRSKLVYPTSYSGATPLAPYELTMSPDAAGRLASIVGPSAPGEPSESTVLRDTKSLAEYSYMGAQPWKRLSGNGVEQRYFDENNSSLYDRLGRIRGVRVVDSSEPPISPPIADFRYGYDRVGNRTYEQRRHEPMTVPSAGYRTRTYKSDLLGRLTAQKEKNLGADSMVNPIIGMSDADPTDDIPDVADPVDGEAWSLDLLGNWNSYTAGTGTSPTKSFDPNARNQYTTIDPDAGGAQVPVAVDYTWLGEIWKDRDRDRKYEWDAFGRLTKVFQGTNPGALTATYRYDAFNRRVEKKVETGDVSGDLITRFVYDGWRGIEERGLTGSSPNQVERVRARYGFGNGLDELIWMDRDLSGSSTTADGSIESRFYVNQDALGSVTVATTERAAGGNLEIKERYTYSAYGSVTTWNGAIPWSGTGYSGAQSASRIGLPYLYTGQRQDAETRNYYYKNRYFDPVMGRFLSRDPMGMAAGTNVYGYVGSSPTRITDPLGLAAYDSTANESNRLMVQVNRLRGGPGYSLVNYHTRCIQLEAASDGAGKVAEPVDTNEAGQSIESGIDPNSGQSIDPNVDACYATDQTIDQPAIRLFIYEAVETTAYQSQLDRFTVPRARIQSDIQRRLQEELESPFGIFGIGADAAEGLHKGIDRYLEGLKMNPSKEAKKALELERTSGEIAANAKFGKALASQTFKRIVAGGAAIAGVVDYAKRVGMGESSVEAFSRTALEDGLAFVAGGVCAGLGATVGAPGGIPGVIVGSVAGGLIGTVGGGMAGDYVGGLVLDPIFGPEPEPGVRQP